MSSSKTNQQPSICIIGSGAAGLSAAYFLKERGYKNVTVLEKENRVGGKCLSLTVDGKSFDLGANYITSSYANVMRLARKFGASTYIEGKLNAYKYTNNEFSSLFKAVLAQVSFFKLSWLSLKYIFKRWMLNGIISTRRPGFGGIANHTELCKPFEHWLKSNGLSDLGVLFQIPISLMGYGQLKQISAAYALTYMTVPTFIDVALAAINPHIKGYPKRFTEGYQRLWQRISWEINVKVGAEVTQVTRGDKIKIEYTELEETLGTLTKANKQLECDFLFIATPLYYDSVNAFLKNMSHDEEILFKKVTYDPFIVTTYLTKGLERFTAATFMVPEPEFYYPTVITRQFDDNDSVSIYTRIAYGEKVDKEKILRVNKEFIKKSCGVELGDYYTFSEFPYFPHVEPGEMEAGFYKHFESIQGQNNTYYVGGLLNFELVETIVNYSKHLVKNNFKKIN